MTVEKTGGYDSWIEPEKEQENIKALYEDEEWYQLLDAANQLQMDQEINGYVLEINASQKTNEERERAKGFVTGWELTTEEYSALIKEKAALACKLLLIKQVLSDPALNQDQKFSRLDQMYQDTSFRRPFEVAYAIFEGIKQTVGKEKSEKWREKMWTEL